MSITIELNKWRAFLCERVYRYDDFLGQMVRGFIFRLGPAFLSVVWRAKA